MSSVEDAAPVQRQFANGKTRLCLHIDELFEQVPEALLLVNDAPHALRINREFVRIFEYLQVCPVARSTVISPSGEQQKCIAVKAA
jgi:hypothetical protein